MKKLIVCFIIGLCLFFSNSSIADAQSSSQQTMEAVVKNIQITNKKNELTNSPIKEVTLEIVSGDKKGKIITIQDNVIPTSNQLRYNKDDHVVISYSQTPDGKDIVYITDIVRQTPLLILLFIFLVLTLAIARWQGVTSIIGMIVSFLTIGKFIIPNILLGNDPLLITLFGAAIIIPITYYLAHGLNKKTTIAIIGTFIALLFTGGLAYVFVEFARLTGFDSEESVYLQNLSGNTINMKSLLLSGIIIGILAVLNDITVSQASIVSSLIKTKPAISFKELYQNAMSVGRDHVASLVNTLVLVYAGASLPLFVLFYNSQGPFQFIVNQEMVATEVLRTLVSSIGIIAAVPITTYLACLVAKKKIF